MTQKAWRHAAALCSYRHQPACTALSPERLSSWACQICSLRRHDTITTAITWYYGRTYCPLSAQGKVRRLFVGRGWLLHMRGVGKDLVAVSGRLWHRIELESHILPAQNKKVVRCQESAKETPRQLCSSLAAMVPRVGTASC